MVCFYYKMVPYQVAVNVSYRCEDGEQFTHRCIFLSHSVASDTGIRDDVFPTILSHLESTPPTPTPVASVYQYKGRGIVLEIQLG